jgi:threonine dehydratase
MQKNNKDTAPALVVIELQSAENYKALVSKMKQYSINYTELNKNDNVFGYLI